MKQYLLGLFLSLSVTVFAQDGTLDPTFGDEGVTITDLANVFNETIEMTIATDGSIWVLGLTILDDVYEPVLVRYFADGTRDEAFDGTGEKLIDPGVFSKGYSYGYKLYPLPGGHVILAKTYFEDIVLTKFDSFGNIDSTFGNLGIVVLDINNENFFDLLFEPGGKFIVVGTSTDTQRSLLFAQYEANGTLDSNFGNNGITLSPFIQKSYLHSIRVLRSADKSFLISFKIRDLNHFHTHYFAKYHHDGSLDTSFGANGILQTPFEGNPSLITASIILQNNKILTLFFKQTNANPNISENFFVRFHEDGSFDTSFGNSGIKTTPFNDFKPGRIFQQTNGRLLIAGGTFENETPLVALKRFFQSGFLDENYTSEKILDPDVRFTDARLQDNGDLIGIGSTPSYEGDPDFALFKYNNNVLNIWDNTFQNFTYSPNPTHNFVTISCAECSLTNKLYQITDTTGKLILEAAFKNENSTISLEGLSAGLYYLTIENTTIGLLKK